MNKELREIKESVEPKTQKTVSASNEKDFNKASFICVNGTPSENGTYVVYFSTEGYPCVDIMTWNCLSQTFERETVDWVNEDYDYEYFHLNEIDGFFKIPEPGWNKKSKKVTVTDFVRDNMNLSDAEFEEKFNKTFLE